MGAQISPFIGGGHPDLANTNYQKNNEIAQIRPYNTYRGVIKNIMCIM